MTLETIGCQTQAHKPGIETNEDRICTAISAVDQDISLPKCHIALEQIEKSSPDFYRDLTVSLNDNERDQALFQIGFLDEESIQEPITQELREAFRIFLNQTEEDYIQDKVLKEIDTEDELEAQVTRSPITITTRINNHQVTIKKHGDEWILGNGEKEIRYDKLKDAIADLVTIKSTIRKALTGELGNPRDEKKTFMIEASGNRLQYDKRMGLNTTITVKTDEQTTIMELLNAIIE